MVNQESRFCFLEFKSVEMTTACLQFDGINVNGKGKIHIKRPNDYNPLMAPQVAVVPQLNVAKLGIIGKTVADGPNKVFVGGLHYHLMEDDVLELLKAFGPVKAFHLVTNDPSGLNSKGYCLVKYVDPAQTQVAIMGLNGMDLGGGKVLTARITAAREDGEESSASLPFQNGNSNHLVGGYNVEDLIDIAMGIQPGTGPRGGNITTIANNPAITAPHQAASYSIRNCQ
jgi:splicing factor U2AF subunit